MLCQYIFFKYFWGVYMAKFMGKISERIKSLRLAASLTQKQLADILNVSEVSLQRFEYGSARPSLDTLIALAGYFDVSLDYLCGRSDDPVRR